MSMQSNARWRRHDPVTQRVARTLDEVEHDPYAWFQRYDPAHDALPQRQPGQGHHVIAFVGALRPCALPPQRTPWWRRLLASLTVKGSQ